MNVKTQELRRLTKAAEILYARERGFLVTKNPADDVIFRLWGRWCDHQGIPDVYARITGKYAHVRLDMAPTGKALTEQALQQVIPLLFDEATLATHRRLLEHRRGHGLAARAIDRYFTRVGNGRPIVLIGSKRVPAERAEAVAEQLAKLARASVEFQDEETVH